MRTSLAIDDLAAHHALSTLPDVWLDHLHGRLSADEAAEAASVTEPDELVERSRVLFAPPSAEDEERRLQALLDAHFAEPIPASGSIPSSGSSRSRWAVVSVVSMVAASLLLFVFVPPAAPPAFNEDYALSLSPGYREERAEGADSSTRTRYHEDQHVTLTLRPAQAVTEPLLGARVFAVAEDGQSHRLDVELSIENNDHGVVFISGDDALGLSAGRWTLVVVVGPRENLPSSHAQVQYGPEAPYDVLDREVEIVSADPASP